MVAAHEVSHIFVARTILVTNPEGMHLRICSLITQQVVQYDAEVYICKGDQQANTRSILDLISLAAEAGTELTLKARGPSAEEALEAIAKIF